VQDAKHLIEVQLSNDPVTLLNCPQQFHVGWQLEMLIIIGRGRRWWAHFCPSH
jgi:hypothetical protein